jgi:hypothetical protein
VAHNDITHHDLIYVPVPRALLTEAYDATDGATGSPERRHTALTAFIERTEAASQEQAAMDHVVLVEFDDNGSEARALVRSRVDGELSQVGLAPTDYEAGCDVLAIVLPDPDEFEAAEAA